MRRVNRGTIAGPWHRQTRNRSKPRMSNASGTGAGAPRNGGDGCAVEEAFEAGLRNHWYALAPASALEDANPFPLRRMGEDLVLWRDASGEIHLFVDSCAHRGARLSLGGGGGGPAVLLLPRLGL